MSKSIHEIFWSNVEYYCIAQDVPLYRVSNNRIRLAKQHKENVTLKRIKEIAELLDIDDYTIFFESVD
ncbi:hypothetical protein [Enterococcus faecalis]|uniref:hypothetical protein n=1 Tax=Enterococcus faecalis TaxID=1351 RepID=UPI0001F0D013|nr:hypothetical protein [Enterococcus faecalis]EFT93888.1 hypothetical protein HMPREF9499_02082 [Enterococcus faecalis TX0012]